MPKKKSLDNQDYITGVQFKDAIDKIVLSVQSTLNLQENLQTNQSSQIKEIEKLFNIINTIKKENEILRLEVKENKQAIEAILNKFNLELKKVVKDKDLPKTLGLHDDYTDRCFKCKSIINRKEKSCLHCGLNKK